MKFFLGYYHSYHQDLSPLCFSAVHRAYGNVYPGECMLDSGAYTDRLRRRLSTTEALNRQLEWENRRKKAWGSSFRASHLVAYDALMNHTGKDRVDARDKIRQTIEAAVFFDRHRHELAPRTLILPIQGSTQKQYLDCARAVLASSRPGDWLGLGGWCILGRHKRLFPNFRKLLAHLTPLVARNGITHIHLFGVFWTPALAMLQYYCDQHGLTCSTDSGSPHVNLLAKTPSFIEHGGLIDNVRHWREKLNNLATHPDYVFEANLPTWRRQHHLHDGS